MFSSSRIGKSIIGILGTVAPRRWDSKSKIELRQWRREVRVRVGIRHTRMKRERERERERPERRDRRGEAGRANTES